ncbi:MAG: efflux RND transporter periplasmic adaptor subunit [Cellulosilyticaceae bacterium]
MNRKKKMMIGVGILVIGGFAVSGVLGTNQSKASVQQIVGPKGGKLVKVGTADQVDIQSKVAASGVLEAQDEEITYAEGNQKIEVVHKKVGDSVKKGDVIITFEQETSDKLERELEKLNLQLQTATLSLNQLQTASKGDVLAAQTNVATIEKGLQDLVDNIAQNQRSIETMQKDLDTAKTDYTVTKELYDNGLASEKELTTAKQQVTNLEDKSVQLKDAVKSLETEKANMALKQESAVYSLNVLLNEVQDSTKSTTIAMKQNDIKALELQKQSLLEDLAKNKDTVVAPIDGVITELNFETGQMVAAGAALFKVIDPNALLVNCEVSPYYATQLQQGLKATVKYNGSTVVEIPGAISRIAPVAAVKNSGTTQTTTLPVEVSINGDLKGLKPGLVVDVKIVTDDVKGIVAVPLLATMEDKDGEAYLFIVKEDYTLEKRHVKQGASNNTYVEVSGVSVGEKVVTNPTEALDNGTLVNYMNPVTEDGVSK